MQNDAHMAVASGEQSTEQEGAAVVRIARVPCCGYTVPDGRPYPVQWNPFNAAVQCHNCGTQWEPQVRLISVRDVFEDRDEVGTTTDVSVSPPDNAPAK